MLAVKYKYMVAMVFVIIVLHYVKVLKYISVPVRA